MAPVAAQWQRDHPVVMLTALFDLAGQLIMRVLPLVVRRRLGPQPPAHGAAGSIT